MVGFQSAEEGDVDASMAYNKQAETLRAQYDSLKESLTQPERTMTVCDVCGVFINSTDNEARRKVGAGPPPVSVRSPGDHLLQIVVVSSFLVFCC